MAKSSNAPQQSFLSQGGSQNTALSRATRAVLALSIASMLGTHSASATDFIWNNGSGDFNWNTASLNWTGGNSWGNSTADQAIFGAAGVGTINLGGGINANKLTFNATGYTIAGNTLTLSGTAPAITTNADATISSVLAGSVDLTKTGTGILTLSGANSYTGGTIINGGTLAIQGAGAALPIGTAVSISNGGTLKLVGGALGTTNYPWMTNSAVASSMFNGSFPANLAIDGNASTYWASQNGAGQADQWIYADLGTQRDLSSLNLTWFNASFSPATMKLQVSSDGSSWTDASATLAGNAASQSIAFDSGTAGRYVRLYALTQNGSTAYLALKEMTASGTAIAANTYTIGSLSSADATTSVSLGTAGNTLIVGDATNTTFTGVISGATGNLSKQGAGTLTLAGANSYTGTTTINGGTLQLGDGTIGRDGSLATSGVTVGASGTLKYNIAGTQTVSYAITGSTGATLVKDGAGTLTFNNTGAVGFGNNGSTVNVVAGTLRYTGLANNTGLYQKSIITGGGATLEMNVASGTNNLGAWNTNYTGGGTLYKTGAGTLTLGNYAGTKTANFDVGALIWINGGTFIASDSSGVVNWSGNKASLRLDAGTTFNAGNADIFLDALNGDSTSAITLGGKSLTTGVANGGGVFAGTITGGASFTKNGTATLVLSGADTYVGPTIVGDGTLAITGSIAASTEVDVKNNAKLLLGGTSLDRIGNLALFSLGGGTASGPATLQLDNSAGQISESVGALSLASTAVLDLGTGSAGSVFLFADSSAKAWTGTLSIYNWSSGTDHLFFGNSFAGLTSVQLRSIIFYSDAGATSLGAATFVGGGEIAPVPEPSALAPGMGMLGYLFSRRRRASRSTPMARQNS